MDYTKKMNSLDMSDELTIQKTHQHHWADIHKPTSTDRTDKPDFLAMPLYNASVVINSNHSDITLRDKDT